MYELAELAGLGKFIAHTFSGCVGFYKIHDGTGVSAEEFPSEARGQNAPKSYL